VAGGRGRVPVAPPAFHRDTIDLNELFLRLHVDWTVRTVELEKFDRVAVTLGNLTKRNSHETLRFCVNFIKKFIFFTVYY